MSPAFSGLLEAAALFGHDPTLVWVEDKLADMTMAEYVHGHRPAAASPGLDFRGEDGGTRGHDDALFSAYLLGISHVLLIVRRMEKQRRSNAVCSRPAASSGAFRVVGVDSDHYRGGDFFHTTIDQITKGRFPFEDGISLLRGGKSIADIMAHGRSLVIELHLVSQSVIGLVHANLKFAINPIMTYHAQIL